MSCCEYFSDHLVNCPDGIQVNAFATVPAYNSLIWVIKDKFGKEYSGTVSTAGDGSFLIPVDELPPGLLTHHSGTFSLKVLDPDNDCKAIQFLAAKYYEEIRFEVKPGTRIKNNLGCPVDVFITNAGNTNDYFTGDGTEVVFELTTAPDAGQEQVFVGGLLYGSPDQYSLLGDQLTFVDPPDDGVKIRVNY